VAGLERVYEVGPVFRAEEHNTSRHLNEYVSLDVEIGFIRDEEELMDLEESLLRFVFLHLADSCREELRLFGVQAPDPYRIPRLPLAEAQALLRQEYKKTSPPGNLDPEGERLLSEYIRKKHRSDFVFITHYPVKKRPFYAMPREDDPQLTRSFDLLYNGLEVTTGGQRIHIYDKLVANLDRFGLNPSNFAHYLEVFKFGMPPHGGFAIGLERLTARLLGLDNVREASLFPRDRNRLAP
ncbi:MAG: aspartate--tRNA(Asn) ligase, partial [Firmicutes bacterium]|nr:aspartate--tRNA(Asn) ligase [Bacillota bacterium]